MAGGRIHLLNCPHCGGAIYKPDGRGRPRVQPDTLRRAFRKLGREARQEDVARELGVTRQALQAYGKREGKQWAELREGYAN